ncbi:metallophosphoesterase family protein [Paenibacillus mendelii]|uniref:Metallophosphoesterase family protein n=1 Tax=Paenibacillus mendelii TaxID=206163 RepID=A0ABV6J836_9BACL|nr:metallophosphoesterase [Paenibacillus mendelii]MCQ6561304.1 metallophosphoesterase [Paenibacillus mendelii]
MSDRAYKPLETVIRIPGLPRKLSIMHITDSHLTEVDDRDEDRVRELAVGRTECFRRGENGSPSTLQILERQAEQSNELQVDFTVFTGDIIDYPTQANFDQMDRIYSSLNSPYLYTVGNHDWNFPFTGERDEVRTEAYPKFSKWAKHVPGCEIGELDGVTIIAVDNSTYQLKAEQVERIREIADRGPCLLFMHIPVAIPSLIPDVVSVWRAPIVMGADQQDLERHNTANLLATESTAAFCQWVNESDSVYGLFCGHVHFAHEDAFSTGTHQYITPPGFEGGCRLITLLPA